MSRKFTEERKQAFLTAVRETGNQTIAAERAKVSRAWVQLHRSTDPGFKAAVAAAVAEARASLSQRSETSPERSGQEPPPGWGFLDGVELVVRGTGGSGGGKRVQIARARLRQWTPRVECRFLATLGATCNVKAACAEVGMSTTSAYDHRERWPAFARRWGQAIEEGELQLEFALAAFGLNPFSPLQPPAPAPVPPMRADEALRALHRHKGRLHGIGKRPGRAATLPPAADVRKRIVRRAAAVLHWRSLSEAQRAAAEQGYARRRPDPEPGFDEG